MSPPLQAVSRWLHQTNCSSTQDIARQEWEASLLESIVVTADEQTAGRGTWGRDWWSDKGNLLLSVASALSERTAADLPRRISEAIAEELRSLGLAASIKGINDIVLFDPDQYGNPQPRKVCGVLVETWTSPRGAALCIGIGLNCQSAPPLSCVGQPATCLQDHGLKWTAREAASCALRAIWQSAQLPGRPPLEPERLS
jgi:biotin-[acetyl-CoA-carboxylase] ligase BirA-like protein